MNPTFSVTKSNGQKELFDEHKLVTSLKKVGANEPVINQIVKEINGEMWDGMPTTDIYSRAFALLRQNHHPTAVSIRSGELCLNLVRMGFLLRSSWPEFSACGAMKLSLIRF